MFESSAISFLSGNSEVIDSNNSPKHSKSHKHSKHKKEKHKKRDRDEFERTSRSSVQIAGDLQTDPVVDVECSSSPEHTLEIPDKTVNPEKPVSKVSFFAQLRASEASKPSVGTLHANAARMEKIIEKEAIKYGVGEWICVKCNATNIKYNVTCEKCHAMKRLKEYR